MIASSPPKRAPVTGLLEWLSFERCATYISTWFGETVTVDDIKQLCAVSRRDHRLRPKLLLVNCPCASYARAWRLFNWYGGGEDDPTRDEAKRDSKSGHHSWFCTDERVWYMSGAFDFLCGMGASEDARLMSWLLSPEPDMGPQCFTFHEELRVAAGGSQLLPLTQNEALVKIANASFPSSQHVNNFHPRLSDYTRKSFVFDRRDIDDWLDSLTSKDQSSTGNAVPTGSPARRMSNQDVVNLAERYRTEGHADFTKRAAKEAGISTARVRQLRADITLTAQRNSWTQR